jgi:hypothetical protein
MAKDVLQGLTLDDLSDAEIERIESMVFCMGGPATEMTRAIALRASLTKAPPKRAAAYS